MAVNIDGQFHCARRVVRDVVGPVVDIQYLYIGCRRCTVPAVAGSGAKRKPCGHGG